jgi:hypothetical protein
LILGGALGLCACETPPQTTSLSHFGDAVDPDAAARRGGSATVPAAAASRPPGRSAYGSSSRGQQQPPDAELLYEARRSDAFGSETYTSRTQVRGPVVEEVHIGNQRVDPNQPVYPPTVIDGTIQPGYVPYGTTYVYDPVTGRRIPVRRH